MSQSGGAVAVGRVARLDAARPRLPELTALADVEALVVTFTPPAADAVERLFVVLAPHGAEASYLRALASVAQLARDASRSKAFCAAILGR